LDKPLVILHGEITTPPFSPNARRWAGFLLRKLQHGEMLTMPDSRPMPGIGSRCHELRIQDAESRVTWRIMYRLDSDAVVVADIFAKKTQKTPTDAVTRCQKRLLKYDEDKRWI
jgi:phage-related protein